jgi:hypothetical protein
MPDNMIQYATKLADILDDVQDVKGLAKALVANAEGHDARLDLVKALLAVTAAVADSVDDDMTAVGDGYDVCSMTGETHAGNGTEDEGRGHALHQYACASACRHAMFAVTAAQADLDERLDAANRIPAEVTAEAYLAAIQAL